MGDVQETSRHTACLHNPMYHPVTTTSPACILTPASANSLSHAKHIQGTHTIIPVVQPGAVVAQLDPRVLLEHRDGQFITVPTFELQPIPQTDINEKIAIYRHPLFPLLRILFEKCELSTSYVDLMNVGSFDNEIRGFITQMAKDNKPFFTDDTEVDSLMLKALQVLRIHLLELEKVNELCKDFCSRYISCLKGKLNSENVMKTLDINTSPSSSPSQMTTGTNSTITTTDSSANSPVENASKSTDKDTSLSQESEEKTQEENLSTLNNNQVENESSIVADSLNELTSGFLSKKTKGTKRGVLPKSATTVLKGWLFQHLVHPYPTEDEKRELAVQTNLSNLQVNNWFINARRRILQPMLESSNSFLKTNKKSKQQRNAAQKDWTNTIGVYNAYRTEALQSTVSGESNSIASSVSWMPSNSPMLVSLPNRQAAEQARQTQAIHFVQVPQIQAGCSSTYLPSALPHTTSPNEILCQQSIALPVYSQTLPGSVTHAMPASAVTQVKSSSKN